MRISILIFLITIAFFSCDIKHPPVKEKFSFIDNGTTLEYFNRFFQPYLDSLNLSDISHGFDSLQIRIWYHHSFSDSADVYIINKRPNQNWNAVRKRFPLIFNSKKTTNWAFRETSSEKGKVIWENLKRLNIMEFKGMDAYKRSLYNDGEIAFIEIATNNSYQISSSECSFSYKIKFEHEEAEITTNIVEIFHNSIEFPDEMAYKKKIERNKNLNNSKH